MPEPSLMAGEFQNVQLADNVALDIGVGVFQAVADAGLRGQVHDPVDIGPAGKRFGHGLAIADINLGEGEIFLRHQLRQTRGLQIGVVIVVEIVDAEDGVAAGQQNPAHMHADEAGGPCYQYRHRLPLHHP